MSLVCQRSISFSLNAATRTLQHCQVATEDLREFRKVLIISSNNVLLDFAFVSNSDSAMTFCHISRWSGLVYFQLVLLVSHFCTAENSVITVVLKVSLCCILLGESTPSVPRKYLTEC